MREAKAKDYWNKIPKYNYKSYVSELNLYGYNGLNDIKLGKGIQIICGLNGAGKTTVLLGIKNLLGIPLEKSDEIKLQDAHITGEIVFKGKKYPCDNKDNQLSKQVGCVDDFGFLEYSSIGKILSVIWNQDNLEELIEQNESIDLQDKELQQINYLIGRNYNKISLVEIEEIEIIKTLDDREKIGPFPFFVVEEGNAIYDSRQMGMGEYCLFYMYWYVNKQNAQSIILIEEPESFVGIKSQKHFMNFIAKKSVDNGMNFIISTHSPFVIENIENDYIHVISRMLGRAVIKKPSISSANSILGVDDEKRGTFLVEDNLAKEFLEVLLEKENIVLLRMYTVEVAGSVSKVTAILKNAILDKIKYRIIGIYDGDQKKEDFHDNNLPYLFLPLVKDVETDMKSIIMKDDTYIEVASMLGKEKEDLFEALVRVNGEDHHDWWNKICDILGVNIHVMMHNLYDIWKKDNEVELNSFLEKLEEIL